MVIAAARHFWGVATKRTAPAFSVSQRNLGGDAVASRRISSRLAATGVLVVACVVPLLAAIGAETYLVTQKGQMFNPGKLSITRGDTVEIINDDGELIHHAYVDSKDFSFDSGDQEPGSKTDIVFSVRGHFVVLCGIHPKMRLDVTVK